MISIVVPMYFEQEVAQAFYDRMKAVMTQINYDYEIIFVNDGSTDNTLPILKVIAQKDEKVKIINFSRNFGHSSAVSAGIDYSLGDAVVLIDADLQDPPEIIIDFIKEWENGYDVVYGTRSKRKGETKFKKVTASFYYKFLDYLTDIKIPQNTGDFRLMDRKVVDALKGMKEQNRFVRGMVSWVGFKQKAINYVRDERYAGSTKYNLKKMLRFASDGIISLSSKPLKLCINVGIVTLFISFALIIYTLVQYFSFNTESGWSSIMVMISFFFGVHFILLGIMGEYIARIYDDVKGRPLYIVDEVINYPKDKL